MDVASLRQPCHAAASSCMLVCPDPDCGAITEISAEHLQHLTGMADASNGTPQSAERVWPPQGVAPDDMAAAVGMPDLPRV